MAIGLRRADSPTIVILGGGSVWTPVLLALLAGDPELRGSSVVLYGRHGSHLATIADFAGHIHPALSVRWTVSLDHALTGAEFVLNQIRVGGLGERRLAETVPPKFGAVGDETLGAGGLHSSIKTRPTVEALARTVAARCPTAWVLNLTNPCDVVTRFWRASGVANVVGLCERPLNEIRALTSALCIDEAVEQFGYIGTNHVGWIVPPASGLAREQLARHPDHAPMLDAWGAIPTSWRRQLERPGSIVAERQSAGDSRADILARLGERMLTALRSRDSSSYDELCALREHRWYADAVVPVLRGLLGRGPHRTIVGWRNEGRLAGLDDDVEVETWSMCSKGAVQPDAPPQAPRCLLDVASFGATRDAAFEAAWSPSASRIRRFVESDPFSECSDRDALARWCREAAHA